MSEREDYPRTKSGERLWLECTEFDWERDLILAIEAEAAAAERERLRAALTKHAQDHQCRLAELILADPDEADHE